MCFNCAGDLPNAKLCRAEQLVVEARRSQHPAAAGQQYLQAAALYKEISRYSHNSRIACWLLPKHTHNSSSFFCTIMACGAWNTMALQANALYSSFVESPDKTDVHD